MAVRSPPQAGHSGMIAPGEQGRCGRCCRSNGELRRVSRWEPRSVPQDLDDSRLRARRKRPRSAVGLPPTVDPSIPCFEGFRHVSADVAKFANRDFLQSLPVFVQALVDLDRRLLHQGMGILAAAHQDKVRSPGQAGMAVFMVEGHPQKRGRPAFPVRGSHGAISPVGSRWPAGGTRRQRGGPPPGYRP